eukprot:358731-Chlamydomonas_euryale.AAC.4
MQQTQLICGAERWPRQRQPAYIPVDTVCYFMSGVAMSVRASDSEDSPRVRLHVCSLAPRECCVPAISTACRLANFL